MESIVSKKSENEYQISKEKCQSLISGVCSRCGGVLVPAETADNAGNPTYWAACMKCSVFCWGVTQHVYDIASRLVDERHYIAYSHMDRPESKPEKDRESYRKYWRESQIAGACNLVMDVIKIQSQISKDGNSK